MGLGFNDHHRTAMIFEPVGIEPVKETMSMAALLASASPASAWGANPRRPVSRTRGGRGVRIRGGGDAGQELASTAGVRAERWISHG